MTAAGLAAAAQQGRAVARRAALAVLLLAPLLALLAMSTADALIRTPHNLRGKLPGTSSADTRQLCVFCHTPEGIAASELQNGPRWQRSVDAQFRFGAYVGELVGPGPGELDGLGHSMVCLSCHDAVQAPVATGRNDDHPIGVPYRWDPSIAPGGAAHGSPLSVAERRAERRLPVAEFRPPSQAIVNQRVVWWASTSRNPSQRTRSDLPLYPRRVAGASTSSSSVALAAVAGTAGIDEDVPHVECGTCHDPHSTNALFLRVSNESSRLCLTCHNK